MDKLKRSNDKRSASVLHLLSKPNYLLGTILQVNNTVNILIVLICSTIISKLFPGLSGNIVLDFLVNTVLVTYILVLFGEILPKIIANHIPLAFAKMMSGAIQFIQPVTKPFTYLMTRFTNRFTDDASSKGDITLEDLEKAVDLAGGSVSQEKKILKGIVKLPSMEVTKVMQPRVDVVALDIELSNKEVVDKVIECGYSRLPVYGEDLDDIRGFLFIKDLLPYIQDSTIEFRWQDYIREAYYVPESKKINDLLEEFRAKRMHLAIVVDEYGGTDGIVTLEDILEEIVGEIEDESDIDDEMSDGRKLKG